MKIGAQIKRYRALKGLSQFDLALAVGYKNQADVSRIERDEQWPDGERIDAIAKALGCSVSDFFIDAEYANRVEADDASSPRNAMDRVSSYMATADEASLDKALRAVEFELPALDPRTQAALAVEVYKAQISKTAADRIAAAINSLTVAVEQFRN